MTMPASMSLLLDGLIDYAGLFPPAKLDMQPMVETYRRVMLDARGWMVGRVIVPVGELEEFELASRTLLPDEEDVDPWCLSVLVSACGDDALASDLESIALFNQRHASHAQGRAVIDVVEMRGDNAEAIEHALDLLPDDLFPFVELPLADDVRGMLAVLSGSEAAAKIRTGGVTPDLYPGAESVASFIVQAAAAGVPFKATAGMHHPLPNNHPSLGVRQLGFLNVFLAAAAAMASPLDVQAVIDMLDIDDQSQMYWGDDKARIGDVEVHTDDIEEARLAFAISYGSCSVDEPWDDLAALGWLDVISETTK